MSRRRWALVTAIGALVAIAVVVSVAVVAGVFPYRAWGTSDPGFVVRLGAPLLRLAVDVAATVCVGALGYAVFFTAPQESGSVSPQGYVALRTAGRWATGWCLAAVCLLPYDAAATAGLPMSRVLTGSGVSTLFGVLEAPKAWLVTIGVTGVVAVGCRLTLRWRPCAVLLGLAVFAVLPPLAVGHSASDTGHDLATSAIMVHVPVAVLWLGVLVALGRAGRRTVASPAVQRRYRRLALGCWLLLAGSGIVDAAVLVPAGDVLTTGYGWLVAAKVVLFAVLGGLGVVARRRIARSEAPEAGVARLLVVELVLLAGAFGVSVGLADLPPPVFFGRLVTGDETLLGYNLHGAPDLARLALDWRVEVLFAPLCVVLAVSYVLGVRRLRRAGAVWPPARTVSWLVGCVLLLALTSSGVGRYAPSMFSLQTAVHMLIGMVVPLLFALGGPLSLARDALPAAPDGQLPGPREWLEALRTSTLVRAFTAPLVCVAVFAGAPFLLYFTDAFDVTVRFHWAHLAMDVVFLVIGYVFAWVVVGVDPLPRPMPNLLRLGVLLAAMPFDLVFGAAVIGSHRIIGNGVVGANMYSALSLPWVHSLSADQRLGGMLGLAFGEAAFLATLVVLVVRWNGAEDGGAGDGYQDLVAALARRAGDGVLERRPAELPVEAAQPEAVGHHQQGRDGHGGAGDQRVE